MFNDNNDVEQNVKQNLRMQNDKFAFFSLVYMRVLKVQQDILIYVYTRERERGRV